MKKSIKNNFMLYFISFLFLFILGMLFTAEYDDLYFLKINDGSIANAWQNAIQYGNGRYFGNFICFAIIKYQFLQAIIKSVSILLLPILCLKLLDIKSKNANLVSILLFVFTAPILLGQVFQWTAGFVNYVIPIDLLLISVLLIKKSDTMNTASKIISFIVVGAFGFSETLFSENTTVFCILVGVLLVFLSFVSKRKNKLFAIMFLIANCIGAFVLIKKPLSVNQNITFNMQYRGTVFDNLLSFDTVKTVLQNLMIFEKTMGQCLLLFFAMSLVFIVSLNSSKVKNKILFKFVFAIYPLLSLINLFAFYNPITNVYLRTFVILVKLVVLCLYIVFAFVLIIKHPFAKADKNALISLLVLVALSAAPLMVVTPIEARCFYLTTVILTLFVIKYFWCIKEDIIIILNKYSIKSKCLNMIKVLSVLGMAVLIAIYADTRYISNARNEYVEQQMAEQKTEIDIPKLPFEYFVVSNGVSDPFKSHYSYKKTGDIKFIEHSAEDWLKEYKYSNDDSLKGKLFNTFYFFIDNQ